MKQISLILLTVFMTTLALATEIKKIEITADQYACADKLSQMDISVSVDGEVFQFSPSCSYSFSQKFKTIDGTECKIDAGMCSLFYPENDRIKVKCAGNRVVSAKVTCP